jgi:tartrate dehydrogenase/decarboxylase/D-malate dehydrogenase
VVDAIEKMLEEKRCLTPDLGGSASTMECGSAFLEMLDRKTEK